MRKTSFPCHSTLPFYFDSTRDGCLKRVVSLKPGKNGGLPWLRIVCIILNHHHIVRDSGTLVEVQALCIIFVLFNILSGKQPVFFPLLIPQSFACQISPPFNIFHLFLASASVSLFFLFCFLDQISVSFRVYWHRGSDERVRVGVVTIATNHVCHHYGRRK